MQEVYLQVGTDLFVGPMANCSVNLYDYGGGIPLVAYAVASDTQGFAVEGNGNDYEFWSDPERGFAASDNVVGPEEYNPECQANLRTALESGCSNLNVSHALAFIATSGNTTGSAVISDRPLLQPALPATELSVAFWLRCSVGRGEKGTILSYKLPGSSQAEQELIIYNPGSLTVLIKGLLVRRGVNSQISLCDGNWHHLAMTWRSSDGSLSLYKDGVGVYEGGPYKSSIGGIKSGGYVVVGATQSIPCHVPANGSLPSW